MLPFMFNAQEEIVDSVQVELADSVSVVVADVQDVTTLSLDDRINEVMAPITEWVSSIIFFKVKFVQLATA